jgi:surface protein
MKKHYLLLLATIFAFTASELSSQNFYLHENGVTCMCPDAEIGETGVVNGITYTKRTRDQITPQNASTTCTSGITDMSHIFSYLSSNGNESFNGDISSWDISNVTNMYAMFEGNQNFNQSLNSWDVSNVTNMSRMFGGCQSFNQPLNNWDVSNVTNMSIMFAENPNFDQDLSDWIFNHDVILGYFITHTNLSIENYDALLKSFSDQNLQNKEFLAEGLTYCDALSREELIINNGWEIAGDVTIPASIIAPENITIIADEGTCYASNVNLGTPVIEGCFNHTHSISNNAPDAFPLGQTQVTWTITDYAGVTHTSIQTVTVTMQVDIASICYVTSDDDEYTKNRIFINNNDGNNVESYEVLRETSTNVFTPMGTIGPGESSFLDETSNNSTQTYRYSLITNDICQNTSSQSPVHTTMLLQSSVAVNNSVNLSWNTYQGVNFGNFEIYRRTNDGDFEIIATLPASNTTYNDTQANVLENSYEYYIGIQVQPCNSKLSGVQIRSNLEVVGAPVGIDSNLLHDQVVLYPNPSSAMVHVQTPDWLVIEEIKLFNMTGHFIRSHKQKNVINIENLSPGLYFIQIITEQGVITRKFTRN